MKLGLATANTLPFTDPQLAQELAQGAERAGFESIWTVEHVVWPRQYDSAYPYHPSGKMPGQPSIPIPDPLIWLTWVGAATTTLRLGTGVLILPQRNPLVLAKELSTIDQLTGGRLELGVGVGWLEEEFAALGIPFNQRGARTDEFIQAMRALWSQDSASFTGTHTSFSDVASNPKPVTGRIPITIGGHSEAAAKRAARSGDGFFPGPGNLELLTASIDALHRHAEAAGRDPSTIDVSAAYPGRLFEDPGRAIESLRGLGVDRLMVHAFEVAQPSLEQGLDRIRSEIIPRL